MSATAVATVLGGLCIVSGSGGAGLLLASNLRRRPEELARLEAALGQLQTEIGYLAAPLPEALRRTAASTAGPARTLLLTAAGRLAAGEGTTAAEAWQAGVAAADGQAAWAAADRRALLDLAPALGASGRDDQVRHLARCRERLAALQGEARRESDRSARVWVYLGALGGMGLLILCL